MGNSFEIRLRNAEGVPIVQLGGTITQTAVKAVRSTLERLAGAGHYHVVLNIERVVGPDWSFLTALADAVRCIKSHYGAVDLVVPREIAEKVPDVANLAALYRLCLSENQAIAQIKRLARFPDGITEFNARLLEQS